MTHIVPSMCPSPLEIKMKSNKFSLLTAVIRKHTSTGLPTLFGNITSAYGRYQHFNAMELPYLGSDGSYHPLPTYGDGSIIPIKYLELALSIAEKSQVLVEWEKGDVVLLDVSLVFLLKGEGKE